MTDPDQVKRHALQGPWQAVLADSYGFVYESVADAQENADDPDDEFTITVVRGGALPHNDSGCRPRLPGSYHSGDKAYELDDVYLDDPDDPSIAAEARFAQAQAMAAGLNDVGLREKFDDDTQPAEICGEVGTSFDAEHTAHYTDPCQLPPGHDELHDWEQAESAGALSPAQLADRVNETARNT